MTTPSYNSSGNSIPQPSLINIFKADYRSLLLLIFPIVSLLLFLDAQYFGMIGYFIRRGSNIQAGDSSIFLILLIVSFCICVPVLFIRIKNIFDHFRDGFLVEGVVTHIHLYKDRGRVEYVYQIDGKLYKSVNGVRNNDFIESLEPGQKIDLVVSSKDHQKAFIKNLYLD